MSPNKLLDNFNKLIRQRVIKHLTNIQGGKYGPPTLEDLNRCGQLHAFLEAGGTIEAVMSLTLKQNAYNSKEMAFPKEWEDNNAFYSSVMKRMEAIYEVGDERRGGFIEGVQWMLDQIHANKEGASSTSQEKLAVEITRAIDSYLDSLIAREPRSDKILEIVRDTIGKHTPISP